MDSSHQPLTTPWSRSLSAVLPPPRRRWLAKRSVVVLLALLLLNACAQPSSTPPRQTAGSPQTTPPPTVTAAMPGPSPVASLLGPAPTGCPSTPPPQRLDLPNNWGGFIGPGHLEGKSPVWIPNLDSPTTFHLNPQGYDPWPTTKIIWEIGPDFSQGVQVQVSNLRTGELAWWGQGGPPQAATQTLILDLNHSSTGDPDSYHGSRPGGFQEWGTVLYLPAAGCYALDATWAAGQWRLIFSAGR